MSKIALKAGAVVFGLYVVLHLVLASSPVQRRVLAAVREALSTYGLDLKIESIEFPALSPKIYLNRVTLSATQKSRIQLANPLKIDKIRIEFQPLALIYRRIIFEDILLFHPVVAVPRADTLYRQIQHLAAGGNRIEVQNGRWTLVVKKVGMVDALLDVASKDPPLAVRSPSLAASIQIVSAKQRSITVDTDSMEFERDRLRLMLHKIKVDVDVNEDSLRINEIRIEGEGLVAQIRGATSLPLTRKSLGPELLTAFYDVKIPLSLLDRAPDLKLPHLDGVISSSGTLRLESDNFTGKGTLRYDDFAVQGYKVGSGSFNFSSRDRLLKLTEVDLHYAGGSVKSPEVHLDLKDRFPLEGELELHGVPLEGILTSVRCDDNPVRMRIDGAIHAKGALLKPFEIDGDLKAQYSNLTVVANPKVPITPKNIVIDAGSGALDGQLRFTTERFGFQANVGILGGKAQTEGYVSFDGRDEVHVKGEGLSLTQLHHISDLELGGTAKIDAEIGVDGSDARVTGNFSVDNAEVQDLALGAVKGQGYFRNSLLTFERMEVTGPPDSASQVLGNGFVDFAPEHAHYRFDVEVARTGTDQIFSVFAKRPLDFPRPKQGELGGRVSIEGGGTHPGVDVIATGEFKRVKWYGENWQSGNFSFDYKPDHFDLTRILLLKRSGGIEVKGLIAGEASWLNLQSHGLRLEELDYLGRAPIMGEVVGDVTLEGPLGGIPRNGRGELHFSKVAFRGNPLPDSRLLIHVFHGNLEFLANITGDQLKARLVRHQDGTDELLIYGQQFDLAPFLAAAMGRDIPTLTALDATGDISLSGNFSDWKSVHGTGQIERLELGLKGTPMHNEQPLKMRLQNGAVYIDRFRLLGPESQVSLDFSYEPGKQVAASFDGSLDLQFLQPFVPGLAYGTGKVSAGLRVTGPPDRFQLLGNLALDDGVFRITGFQDEFRSVQAQFSVSQDRLNVDKFEAVVNGGRLNMNGDIAINRFKTFAPNLTLNADHVLLKTGAGALSTTFSGDFTIRGKEAPYLLGGSCLISEAHLTRFDIGGDSFQSDSSPVLKLDVTCDAKDHVFVNTDIMDAEFRSSLHLVGDNSHLGLLGSADSLYGSLLFRETKFALNSGSVKFESSEKIAPRFAVSGLATVKDQSSQAAQQYEVNLQAFGTPDDYKVRLTSSPPLAESDLISLLLLGVTTRSSEGNNYFDLGSTVMGQIPFKSKIQNELGVNISINSAPANISGQNVNLSPVVTSSPDLTVPSVQIKKDLTNKTKLSYSNTLETIPVRELKIEHALDDNFSINATATDGAPGSTSTQSVQSYGLDLIYHFRFK